MFLSIKPLCLRESLHLILADVFFFFYVSAQNTIFRNFHRIVRIYKFLKSTKLKNRPFHERDRRRHLFKQARMAFLIRETISRLLLLVVKMYFNFSYIMLSYTPRRDRK